MLQMFQMLFNIILETVLIKLFFFRKSYRIYILLPCIGPIYVFFLFLLDVGDNAFTGTIIKKRVYFTKFTFVLFNVLKKIILYIFAIGNTPLKLTI